MLVEFVRWLIISIKNANPSYRVRLCLSLASTFTLFVLLITTAIWCGSHLNTALLSCALTVGFFWCSVIISGVAMITSFVYLMCDLEG